MNFRPGPLVHAVLATEGPRLVDIQVTVFNPEIRFLKEATTVKAKRKSQNSRI